ncbi:MAG: hypothetical protein ACR2IF_12435 [Terriglobales bacterium]
MLTLPLVAGKKPSAVPLMKLPPKTAEVAALALPPLGQKCANWAWASELEVMLKGQQVSLNQNYWVQKANGGEVCVETLPSLEDLTRLVDGAYVLDDGRKVRLVSKAIDGAPGIPDDVIGPLREGRPLLMFWKGRALAVRAVVYDEYIYPNGQRMFQIREMKMVDPLLPGKDGELGFVTGRDDASQITGIYRVVVEPVKTQPWQR